MSMRIKEGYCIEEVVCSKCREDLKVTFLESRDASGEDTYYKCSCGETMVTSKEYHNFKDYYRNKKVTELTTKTVKVISEFVNKYSSSKKIFVRLMANEHRTLQQSFTNLCLVWLKHLSLLQAGEYDGRNEASVMLAKEIMEKVENANYTLPMV